MDVSKLSPWNWFKKEEARDEQSPVPAKNAAQPVSSVDRLHSDIDRLFEDAFRGRFFSPGRFPSLFDTETEQAMLRPHLDIGGTEKEYVVTVELPGVSDKDITVELRGDALIIRGEKKYEHKDEDKSKGYYRMERSYGSFQRVLALPDDVDPESIQASHKDGILTLTIARTQPAPSDVKKIDVNTA
ncbi:Hsp20/alpha crystallin family protein [Desulfovibrio inopinatus]|uniref:Hsp20/alpha crystallin family protein n=1 Tax=Desulfovibrio inopinatus TaxID=102109 RepID=UPI0003F72D98|nr:Hsp20/alpha crystallin family protein [Desulfovibrio inopinatus]